MYLFYGYCSSSISKSLKINKRWLGGRGTENGRISNHSWAVSFSLDVLTPPLEVIVPRTLCLMSLESFHLIHLASDHCNLYSLSLQWTLKSSSYTTFLPNYSPQPSQRILSTNLIMLLYGLKKDLFLKAQSCNKVISCPCHVCSSF